MSYARTAVTRMTLDMHRPDLQRSETITQGDTNRRWEVTLINGGAPFRLPPNWTAALTGIKPDGTGLLNGCSVADGKIIYDFAAGAEIATCAGNYPVQFDIWDEVGDLVASPKLYVNVLADVRPHAELDSEGQYTLIGDAIKKITDMEKDVDLLEDTALAQGDDIDALKNKVTTAGSVTIPTTEWSDDTPRTARFKIDGFGNGMTALLYPSDEETRKEASRVKLSAYPQLYMGTDGSQVEAVVPSAEVVPTKALKIDYIVIKTDNTNAQPRVALIGVDAYGEGGGGTGSGVDETAVKKIINSMLGNVANERQYSADNPPPYPVTSVNGKTGAVMLTIPSKASDIRAEEAGAVSTHNADQTAHPYLSGRVATALDRISGHDTNIEEINTSVAERLKTADLAAKLDAYKAAQGLVSNTTSNLTNYYLKSEIYTKEEVASLISAIPKFEIKVVSSLPTSNISLTTVYLVKDTTEGGGLYTEYIYVNGTWEELGNQSLDLSGYVTDEELDNLLKSYATLTTVSELIADALKPYATDEEVAEAIRVATVNFVTGSQVTTAINEALKSYYTSAQVDAQVAAQIKTALAGYVPKEEGKGLSANDYTDADKAAVAKAASDSAAAVNTADQAKQSADTAKATALEIKAMAESGELDGEEGLSAYEVWLARGNTGSEEEFLDSLKGDPGDTIVKYAPATADSVEWLEANGDKAQWYLLPDGMYYRYGVRATYEDPDYNWLQRATKGDDQGNWVAWDGTKGGYSTDYRLNSSGEAKPLSGASMSGHIPAKVGENLRFVGALPKTGTTAYVVSYNADGSVGGILGYSFLTTATISKDGFTCVAGTTSDYRTYEITVPLTAEKFGANFTTVRFSCGTIDEQTVVTRQKYEGGVASVVAGWASTGHGIDSTEYGEQIAALVDHNAEQDKQILYLRDKIASGIAGDDTFIEAIERIRYYDKPLMDGRMDTYLLNEDIEFDETRVTYYTDETDKDAIKRKEQVQRLYDDYADLCSRYPNYIREITDTSEVTDDNLQTRIGGLCTGDTTMVRAYEVCELEGHHVTTDATRWSERKPTFVIVTGIHREWNGVYSMRYALERIITDPDLRWLRRNCRFVVLPISNPFSFYGGAAAEGHYNANGVEIHNNFRIDFSNTDDSTHGTAPMTERETWYIDNAIKAYRDDAICLLSCHSFPATSTNFIWGSTATKLMTNTVYRVISMMSYAWIDKYGDAYTTGFDAARKETSDPTAVGDYRCGKANISTSSGTEAKAALYHGVQGLNVEVSEGFWIMNLDGTNVSLAVSRGTEAYVNLLSVLAATFDANDRKEYAPTPAYTLE